MTNTLYCFGESGNAYKAALALTLAGVDWTPRHVDFFAGEARGPDFRKINPMGEVPVLDADGLIMTQSGVIQDWVMDETGKLCGDGSKATRREILRWTIFDNQKVCGMAGPLRFVMNFIPADKRPQGAIDWMGGAPEGRVAGARGRIGHPRLAGGRQPDLRRHLVLWLSLLPRAVRLRPGRLSGDRPLARPPCRDARLGAPL